MFDSRGRTTAVLVQRMAAAVRAENRAVGQRLTIIGELDVLRSREVGERETWLTDTQEALSTEIGAALGIAPALAASYLYYSRALRLRLPRVGALLVAGDIDYRTFQTIVYRTELIIDDDVMAAVDAQLAVRIPRWHALTQGRLGAYVDQIVARADRDAVRRRRDRYEDREFCIWDAGSGLAEVFGPRCPPTPTLWMPAWMCWRTRSATAIRALASSAAPTRWVRLLPGRNGWHVAVGGPIAPPSLRRRQARWWFM
ncbi:13e12 repeat-containing protein [Mycobacterium xenopi RIVM700367]|nr:13e12 repeat-containing protein [Mycobacterium xenopi RIVM700367]